MTTVQPRLAAGGRGGPRAVPRSRPARSAPWQKAAWTEPGAPYTGRPATTPPTPATRAGGRRSASSAERFRLAAPPGVTATPLRSISSIGAQVVCSPQSGRSPAPPGWCRGWPGGGADQARARCRRSASPVDSDARTRLAVEKVGVVADGDPWNRSRARRHPRDHRIAGRLCSSRTETPSEHPTEDEMSTLSATPRMKIAQNCPEACIDFELTEADPRPMFGQPGIIPPTGWQPRRRPTRNC